MLRRHKTLSNHPHCIHSTCWMWNTHCLYIVDCICIVPVEWRCVRSTVIIAVRDSSIRMNQNQVQLVDKCDRSTLSSWRISPAKCHTDWSCIICRRDVNRKISDILRVQSLIVKEDQFRSRVGLIQFEHVGQYRPSPTPIEVRPGSSAQRLGGMNEQALEES